MPVPPAATQSFVLLGLLLLIAWRVWARFRRMVGRQRLSRVRPWITLTIFPTLVLLFAFAAQAHPERLLMLAAAMGAGLVLSRHGLKLTKFEAVPGALYYTPHTWLGVALTLLFVARIAWRVVEVTLFEPHAPHTLEDFARSPLTLSVFGLLAGYYVGYAIGLVRWRRAVLRRKREREAGKPPPGAA
jgi:hypothetical protein